MGSSNLHLELLARFQRQRSRGKAAARPEDRVGVHKGTIQLREKRLEASLWGFRESLMRLSVVQSQVKFFHGAPETVESQPPIPHSRVVPQASADILVRMICFTLLAS